MNLVNKNTFVLVLVITLFSCSYRSIIKKSNVDISSSLSEISSYNNDKAEIAKLLPEKIGNMELFNVVDYTKMILVGPDMGYGIFYDLKKNGKGSGNIFLYKRYRNSVEEGLSEEVLDEIMIERSEIEHSQNFDSTYSKVSYGNMEFYQMAFLTRPDSKNEVYTGQLLISGHNGVYIKVLFYYPIIFENWGSETDFFMNSLIEILRNDKT